MEDTQIIEQFWHRNEEAIKETSAKYGKYCYAIANRVLRNAEDSEECVNDTWMKAWNGIPPAKPECLKLFLAKITRNLAFNKYEERNAKKRGRGEIQLVLDELEECIAGSSDVESELSMRELEKSINRFVQSLSKKEANLFVRRYFFTESVGMIAGRYGMTENHVMVTLSRTRSKLKKHLEQEDYVV